LNLKDVVVHETRSVSDTAALSRNIRYRVTAQDQYTSDTYRKTTVCHR